MPDTTPIYGFRFQELGDPPHGANLGAELAADVEATVNEIDDRVDVLESVTSADLYVRKAVTTSRVSSPALADDPELTRVVVAGRTYVFDVMLNYDSSTAADFRVLLVAPAGATFVATAAGIHGTGASTNDDRFTKMRSGDASEPFGGLGVGTIVGLHIHGNLVVDATGGAFKVQWCQDVTSVAATRVFFGSHMALRRVT